ELDPARQLVTPEELGVPADQGLDGVVATGAGLEDEGGGPRPGGAPGAGLGGGAAGPASGAAPGGGPAPGPVGLLGPPDLGLAEGGVGPDHDHGPAAGERRGGLAPGARPHDPPGAPP